MDAQATARLRTERYRLLLEQILAELVEELGRKHGAKARAADMLGLTQGGHVTQILDGKNVGEDLMCRAMGKLGLRKEFFTAPDLVDPHYRSFLGPSNEPRVELDPVIVWPAWERLENEGVLDEYRARGLSDEEIQHVGRTPWRGQPTERDFIRELDSKLAGPRPPGREPDLAREARTKKS